MKRIEVSLPEVAFVAVTRGMAGMGMGLLLSNLIESAETRKAVGLTLLAIGALTTIPIAVTGLARRRSARVLARSDRVVA
ncbi:MAG TPA: hypothetical protein VFB54_06720 [Burkholderiales bacterium]|nr:hypothetical protein [Burkholderiales bacterium]